METDPFALPQWTVQISTVVGIIFVTIGTVTLLARAISGRPIRGGVQFIGLGCLISCLPLIISLMVNFMLPLFDNDPDSSSGNGSDDQPAPAPEPEPEPAEPMDLTVLWAILIIAASLAILSGLGYATYRLVTASKRKRETAKQARAETAARWTAAKEQHTEAVSTVASYELDVVKAIDYPAFNDISVPEVSAMTKAMRRARDIEFQIDKDSSIGGSDDLLKTYRDAVDEFVIAVEVAEAKAKQIRWKTIPQEERKDLKLAKKLLAQAEDPGNPENVRHNLYERLKKVIDRLNESHGSTLVPTPTIGAIEEQTRLLIEAPETGTTADELTQKEAIRL